MDIVKNTQGEIVRISAVPRWMIDHLFAEHKFNQEYIQELISTQSLDRSNIQALSSYQELPYEFIINNLDKLSTIMIIHSQVLSTNEINTIMQKEYIKKGHIDNNFINFKTHNIIGEFRKRYCYRCNLETASCFMNNCEEQVMKRVLG